VAQEVGERLGAGSLLQRPVQTMTDSPGQFSEFIGVYNAESTVLGEVSYWLGARLGIRHCSLCDITHGLFTKRTEWQECESALPVPFTTFHINDAPAEVTQAANGQYPIVLGRNQSGIHIVLNADELEKCNGSPQELLNQLQSL
jgi:hypothetical protein